MQDSQTLQDEAIWSNGSYEEVAPNYLSMAGSLVERTSVSPDDDVLDIGCGTGSVTITAARRGASVTGVDITPAMLAQARKNAAVADVEDITWQEANARDLPFEDDSFDVTLSSLGHMYADPPEQAADELLRVTRPDGYIGFTAWTPTSLYPFLAGVLTTYLPPDAIPEMSAPPFQWGDSAVVEQRLGGTVQQLAFETGTTLYPTLSPAHFWRELTETSGVFESLVGAVDEADMDSLRTEAVETIQPYFDETRNAIELEYLRTTAKR